MEKAYVIVKELSRVPKSRSKIVKDRNGQWILNECEIVTKRKEYIEDLYQGLIEKNYENRIEISNKDRGSNVK